MKVLISIAFMSMSWGLGAAQTPPVGNAAPGLTVVEKGWRKLLVRNPALVEDQFALLENQAASERAREDAREQNRNRVLLGKEPAPLPPRNAPVKLSPPKPGYPFVYVYSVKIINTGVKKIRGIIWEYLLIDPTTGTEVGRHRFASKVSVGPGESATLRGRSTLPPASSVHASEVGEAPEGQHSEQVMIKTIFYTDKSVWERIVE